ncbi:hypothetical protein FHT09_001991 [Xanthomonas arboricola]|uniref:hypothetical protein n=1 Tax=Xanthomonas TaxID=338 RepID=UPI000CED8DB2|nr:MULTISPECIES: hypothetical protein [Xanthomonas]MBB5736251.1 hypothetical protein [Xanthomonas sp. CFBP 8152]PPT74831.1 hypothetical protein XarbCFBP8152_18325 [Xanthomonas arboricola]
MTQFVDTRDWPLVALHMPEHVPDAQADALLAQLQAVYARAEPYVLLMQGAQLPRQSAQFMAAYTRWSRDSFALQQRYCLGAVRVVEDPAMRDEYSRQADGWNASGQAAYPYRIVATHTEALAQAGVWLAAAQATGTVPAEPAQQA